MEVVSPRIQQTRAFDIHFAGNFLFRPQVFVGIGQLAKLKAHFTCLVSDGGDFHFHLLSNPIGQSLPVDSSAASIFQCQLENNLSFAFFTGIGDGGWSDNLNHFFTRRLAGYVFFVLQICILSGFAITFKPAALVHMVEHHGQFRR